MALREHRTLGCALQAMKLSKFPKWNIDTKTGSQKNLTTSVCDIQFLIHVVRLFTFVTKKRLLGYGIKRQH